MPEEFSTEIRSFFLSLFKALSECGDKRCAHLAGHFRISAAPTTAERENLLQDSGPSLLGALEPLPTLKNRPRSVEEARAFFVKEGLRGSPYLWFHYWEGQGWRRGTGGAIKDWRSVARVYARSRLSENERDPDPETRRAVVLKPRPDPGPRIWKMAQANLAAVVDEKLYRSWFAPVEQLLYAPGVGGGLWLLLPSEAFRWAFDRYSEKVGPALRAATGVWTTSVHLELARDYEAPK